MIDNTIPTLFIRLCFKLRGLLGLISRILSFYRKCPNARPALQFVCGTISTPLYPCPPVKVLQVTTSGSGSGCGGGGGQNNIHLGAIRQTRFANEGRTLIAVGDNGLVVRFDRINSYHHR